MKPPYAIGSVASLMRTDGVHCRESAGIGPVNLKVCHWVSPELIGSRNCVPMAFTVVSPLARGQ